MVCVPCIVVPFLLWLFHKFIRPYLTFWNPWKKQDTVKEGSAADENVNTVPLLPDPSTEQNKEQNTVTPLSSSIQETGDGISEPQNTSTVTAGSDKKTD